MSSSTEGILNYNEMEEKDKAYVFRLAATIIAAIIAGMLSGEVFLITGGWSATIGFTIYFATMGLTYFLMKFQFEFPEMEDSEIMRHGIVVCFFTFLYFWITVFNFVIQSQYASLL